MDAIIHKPNTPKPKLILKKYGKFHFKHYSYYFIRKVVNNKSEPAVRSESQEASQELFDTNMHEDEEPSPKRRKQSNQVKRISSTIKQLEEDCLSGKLSQRAKQEYDNNMHVEDEEECEEDFTREEENVYEDDNQYEDELNLQTLNDSIEQLQSQVKTFAKNQLQFQIKVLRELKKIESKLTN